MKLLSKYALSTGSKIDRPYLYESYFPLPCAQYITVQMETPNDARNYSYFQDVLDMIVPILSKLGIKVIQVGLGKESAYQRILDLRGQTNFNQLAYVMRRSMLHFGPDSFGVHLASSFNVPIVALYSDSFVETAGPNFGDPKNQTFFKAYERVGNKKPSHSVQENPKSINTIKPEEIANAIFKQLGINAQVPFETIFTGNRYGHQIVRELIPDSQHFLPAPEHPIELRLDVSYDEKLLAHHLNYWQKAVLVTDKPLPIPLLKHFKSHIALLAYHLPENDSPEFIKEAVGLGIPIVLLSRLDSELIQKKKIKYYEYGMINKIPAPDPIKVEQLRKDVGNLYYRSCKLISSNGKVYGSYADLDSGANLATDYEYRKVVDSPKFWQDLEFFTIVKKI